MRRRKLFCEGITRRSIMRTKYKPDQDYGLAEPLDNNLSVENLSKKKTEFLQQLMEVNRVQIEMLTREQSLNQTWVTERKKRLTASKFGEICKMRANTSCKNKVHSMLYKPQNVCKQIRYGIEMEPKGRV